MKWIEGGVAALVSLLIFAAATPAHAHGVSPGDPEPTNWQTTITSGAHPAVGVSVKVDADGRLTLTNVSDRTVTVMGYEDEPYLMIGPEGLFRNRRSPATYLNTTNTASTSVPATADASAAPDWVHLSADRQVAWHDHRTHWMGGSPPPMVAESPRDHHVIYDRWEVPLSVDDHRTQVVGQLTWIPAPSPITPLLVAVAVGVAAALTASTVLGLRLTGLAVLAIGFAHVIGSSAAVANPPSPASVALLLPGCSLVVGLVLPRGNPRRVAATTTGIVGVALVLALTHDTFLTHSQLPTTLSGPVARLSLGAAFGLAIGTLVAAGRTARRQRRRPAVECRHQVA